MTAHERKALPNYYLALDITPGVSHNDILHAYNRSKSTYSNGSLASYGLLEGEANSSILEEIESAFTVLGNPSKRREYDLKMGFHTWTEDDSSKGLGVPNVITTLLQNAKPKVVSTPELSGTVAPFQKKVAAVVAQKTADFDSNPEFEKQIAECKQVDGAFLRAVRIYRRFTVEQLAERCKLSSSHINAIENEDGSNLHQPVYLRGHIFLICQALDIPDASTLSVGFVQRLKEQGKLAKPPF